MNGDSRLLGGYLNWKLCGCGSWVFAGDRLEFAVEAVWECNDKLHTILTIERLSC
jgi:hypothetical protein